MALPDILKTDFSGGQHLAYINLGETNSQPAWTVAWSAPVPIGGDPLAANINLQTTGEIGPFGRYGWGRARRFGL